MPLTATTLAGRKATSDTWISLTNPACVREAFPHMLVLVDNEWMRIGNTVASLVGAIGSPVVGVVPGTDGTTATPHAQNTPVVFGHPIDFTSIGMVPGGIVTSQSFSSGAITGRLGLAGTSPTADTLVYLTNPAANTQYSLNPPTPDQRNTLVLLNVTGGNAGVENAQGFGTSAATQFANILPGSALTIRAHDGKWLLAEFADEQVGIP
jgi:hypothetical protein